MLEFLKKFSDLNGLSPGHRHEDHRHEGVPDQEEEGEDDLAGPVGLTDADTHPSHLARIHSLSGVVKDNCSVSL